MEERVTWPGITQFTNFEFQEDGVSVIRGYKIGKPEFYPYKAILKKNKPQGPTKVKVNGNYSDLAVAAGALRQKVVGCSMRSGTRITCTEDSCHKTF